MKRELNMSTTEVFKNTTDILLSPNSNSQVRVQMTYFPEKLYQLASTPYNITVCGTNIKYSYSKDFLDKNEAVKCWNKIQSASNLTSNFLKVMDFKAKI